MTTPKTLLDIRYYEQTFHPDSFKGKGFVGFLVIVLNWVRYWTETVVQYLILRMGVSREEIEKTDRKEIVRQFWRDVKKERVVSTLNSPLEGKIEETPSIHPRELRYQGGRRTLLVTDLGEEEQGFSRPQSLEPLIQRLMQPGRRGRYGQPTIIHEDFEPVSPEKVDKKE